ncbi:tenascin-X-like isoform X3 [Scyliorhinus torazame]|uniref:tenascin-X-like isoform X3 n=1 Tax=Scyliorhinus torazame TaxID=75743 RepID=UPI003B59A1A2
MGLIVRILLLFVAVFLNGGDCGVFVKTIRQRRALLPNVTSGHPTTFNHVYNIQLPHCKSCTPNISKPLARIFEAKDEARDDKRFEHTVDPTHQVVFTHRINIPPQVCGCDDIQALLSRLETLEKQVVTLRRQCSSNTCCGTKNAIDCGPHGTFSSSTCGCVCEVGWSGPTCSDASCPANCHPRQGDCVAGRCVCREGFMGEDCSQEICPDDCNDQGRCIDDKCVCFPGYTGYGCTEEICPDDCRGHGRCVDGRCVCNKGYSGFDCGLEDCPGGCSSQGQCIEGKCACNAGFSGSDCSQPDCPSNCHGRGNCIKGKCICKKGFTGPDCGVKACPQNCNDRGRCVNGKCVCNTGYSGPACSVQACPDNCNQRGKCVNGKCVCNTGYSGPTCSVQACPQNCNQRGKCVNGKCVCNTGYSGPACSVQACPQNCNQRGKCVNGKCVCNTGYSGPACSVQACPQNCNQQGKCVNGKCVCNTGYSGSKCSVQNCPNNCNQQGRCTDGKCVCKDGFTGNDCSIGIAAPTGLHVKKILETKATVGWELPQVPVDAWEITFQPLNEDNGKLTKRLAGTKSSFQQTGLASGQEYQVTLRAQKGKKFGTAVSKTLRTLIDGPRNLHVVSATNSTIKLGWKKPQASIDLYRLNYSSATGKHSQVVVPAGDISAVLTGLEAGVEHNIILVGEQGGHQSKAATTKGTTESLPQWELAGRHSAHTVAANKNKFIQDISRAISRKIAAAELSADVAVTARSVIRRYPAFAKSPLGSPKVLLGTPPARVKVSAERGQEAKESKVAQGPIRKKQGAVLVGPGRPVGPGRKVTGSPGTSPALKHKKGLAGSPSSNGARETSPDVRRAGKRPATPRHTGTPEPTKQQILGGKDKTGHNGSSRLTYKVYLPPVGSSQEPAVSRASVTGSKESPNPLTLNATSSHIALSWDIAEGLFDTLLLSYRDPSTNVVLSEMVLGGDQRKANITGLTIGKSYKVSLHGTSGSNPSQPIHISGVAVSGPGEGPAVAHTDSTAVQGPAETQGNGSEEEEDDDDEEEEEEEENEEAEEVGQEELELPVAMDAEMENVTISNITSENRTRLWAPEAFNHWLVSTQNATVSNASQTQEPGDLRPFDLSGLTPAVNSNTTHQAETDDKLSAPLTDQVASFRNVTVRDITARDFRLSWKVPEGAFDSFVIQYRVSSSSTRWEERKVQGRFRSAVIKGLSPSTVHTVRLYGVREGQRTTPFTLDVTTDSAEKVEAGDVGKLDKLTSSNITDHSLQLSWTVEKDFDTFLVHYRVDGSKDVQKLKLPGSLRSSIITGLRPSTKYTIYLYGVSFGQRTKPITTTATTAAKEAGKLGSLSTSNITANSLRLSWTVDRAFDSFLIQYRVQGSEETHNITVTSGRRFQLIVGLRPTTRYIIYLYGISAGLRTKPLTTIVTTAEERPQQSKVSDLSVSNITADSLQLSWVTEKEYDSFFVEYGAEEDQDMQSLSVTGDLRSSLITSLRPTTAYTFYLYGVSAGQRTTPLTAIATTTADRDKVKPSKGIKLEDLSVSNITADSFLLSWGSEKDFDSFIIQYGVRGSGDMQNHTVTGDRRVFLITGLRPTTVYTIYIYGISGGVRTKPLNTVITTEASTDRNKPSKVLKLENLSVSNITADSFQLSWGSEKDFDSFTIQYGVRGSGDVQNLTVTGDRRLSLITGLRPTTVYTAYIYGISGGVRTKALNTVITTKASTDIDTVKPSKVIKLENLSVSNITADSFLLSWGSEKDFDSFIIQYGVRGSGDAQNLTVTGDRRMFLITGLRPTTVYTIYIYGLSGGVRTKALNTVITTKASTDKVKPSKVIKLENLSVSNITADSFQLSWGSEKDFDSFIIQYGVRGSGDMQNLTVTGDRRVSLITGLRPTTVYTIYIYGIAGGVRTKALNTTITTKGKPSEVIKLSASNVTADSARLSWSPQEGVDFFVIQYRVRGSAVTHNVTVTGDRRSFIITGLKPATKYLFSLYSVSGEQHIKSLTLPVAMKGKAKPAPSKLGDLSVSNITSDSIPFSWTAEKGFDAFLIRYKVHGSGAVRNFTVPGDNRSMTITGLKPRTKYTVYVYGIYNGKRTKPLSRVVTTKASTDKVAGKLGSLSTSNITANSLRFSWTVDRAFDSFLILYRVQGSEETHNITVSGGRQSHLIVGLRPTTRYIVYLYGISGGLRTKPVTITVTTTDKETVTPVRLGSWSTSNITANSLRLSWTVDRAFDSFLIQYRVQGSEETHNITVTGGRRSHLIVGLRPTTKYIVHLYGIFNGKRTKPLTTALTTTVSTDKEGQRPITVAVVDNVSVSKVTAHSLELSWQTERTYDSFLIEYGLEGSEDVRNLTVTGDRRSTIITGLRPTTAYSLYLYGVSAGQRTRPLTTSANTSASATVKPNKLGAISVSHITIQSFKLSWTASKGFDSFLIQYSSVEPRGMHNLTVAGDRRSSFIKGLRPTTVYTVRLYGVTKGQRTKPLTNVVTTTAPTDKDAVKPIKLAALSVSEVTAHSVRVSWTTRLVFSSFLIQYRAQGSQSVRTLTVTAHRRSYLITGLRPNTKYTIYVYGVSRGQRSAPSTVVITTRASTDKESQRPITVAVVDNVSVSKVTAHSLELSWQIARTYDSFLIEYGLEGSEDVRNLTVTGDHRSTIITGLRPTTVYRLYLYGVTGGQRTRPLTTSANTSAPTDKDAVKPVKLAALSVSEVTAHSVRVSWTTRLVFSSFLIQYRAQGSQSVRTLTVTAHRRSYLITGLRPNTKYTIYVYGVSRGQRSAPSTVVITTRASTDKESQRPITVAVVDNVSVSKVTAHSLELSWQIARTYDSFLIEYGLEGSEDVRNLTVTGDHRSTIITGLRPTTVYRLHLYGVTGGQRTRPLTTSANTSAPAVKDAVKPVKLAALSVSEVTAHSVRVSWTTRLVFSSFLIQYRAQGSQSVRTLTVTAHRRSYLITGLRPNTKYTIYVYGVSRGQRSAPSTVVITTRVSTDKEGHGPIAVAGVGNVSVSKVTVHSLELSWQTERTYDSFLIEYRLEGSEDVRNLTVTGDRRSIIITGLRPTTVYRLYLYGVTGGQRTRLLTTSANTSASAVKDTVKPSKLGDISVSHITTQSFKLSWTASKGFDSFLIQYSSAEPQGVHNLTMAGNQRSSVIKGLRPTTVYTVRLYGVTKGQRTKPLTSVVTTAAPTGTVVMEPNHTVELGSLSALALTPHSVRLSWLAKRDFDSYAVQYRAQGLEEVRKLFMSGHSRSHTVTGLRPTTKYTFYLYGISSGRHTTPLSSTATTKDSADEVSPTPGVPVRPGVSNVSPDSLQLSWTVERVYEFFLIQYRAHGSPSMRNLTVAGDQRIFLITGLRPSTKYTIYLYGVFESQITKLMAFVASTTASIVKEGVRPGQVKALGSLSVANIMADSVELSWSTQWAFDSYVIQFRAQGSEEVRKLRVTGNRRSYVLLGLKPTTKYTIYVYGVSGGRHTSPLSIVVTTTVSIDTNGVKPSRLSKLIRLSGNNVTQNSLQIFWAAESGFDSFLIQYRVEGSKEVRNFTVPVHRQSSFIEGLRPSTKYLISLYGLSGNRRTRPLTTIITTAASADKEGEKSGRFGSLSFSNITADSLLLSWTAENVFDSFLIQYKSQGSEILQNTTVTGDRRTTYITGLRPTTNYTIYLYGVSGGQLSRPLVALLTITAVPIHTAGFNTLGRLSVSDVDTHSLKLTWTVEEGAFDSFLVQYRDSQGRLGAKEVTVPGNLRYVAIADLIPGTEYLISLYGVLKNQQTEPIPIVARTARESRSRLRFTDLRDTSVTVHWAAPSGPVDSFKIFYVPTEQGEPKSDVIDGKKTNITLKGLAPDTQYEVNLVSIRGAIETPPILDHFTTAPDAPTDLKAVNVSETMALLTWRPAIASVDHYVITYRGPTVSTVSRNVPGNSAELQLTGLSMNTEYTAEIYSVKGDRKSLRISTSFVTGSDLPRDLAVRDISLTEALVSWKSPRAPVTGYLLLYGTEGGETQQVKVDSTVTSNRLHQLLPSTRYTVRLHALRDGGRTAAITAFFSTVSAHIPFPKDCGEEHSNGRKDSSVVSLYLDGNKEKPFKAYCDMTTNGGGWMVFQRRMNGKTNFMRNWKAFSTGFGALTGEHWLGLQYLHQMTSQQRYELRVDLRNGNESAYAVYDNFMVESPAKRYRLTVGGYHGNAGDSLSYHHGSNFTTLDSDNDEALTNCAVSYRGGWWYKNCHRVNLNGEYGNHRDHQGVNWYGWKGFEFSIPFTEMKMRPYKFAQRAARKA